MDHFSIENVFVAIGYQGRYQYFIFATLFATTLIASYTNHTYSMQQELPHVTVHDVLNNIDLEGILKYEYCDSPNYSNLTVIYEKSTMNWALDFEIYCSPTKVSLIGTMYLLGSSIGALVSLIFNIVGRKASWLINLSIYVPFTILLLTKNIVVLYICCAFFGVGHMILLPLKSMIVTEHFSNDFRPYVISAVMTVSVIDSTLGYYLIKSIGWKLPYVGIFFGAIVLFGSLYFLFVESPRFYAFKMDITQYLKSINYIRKFNKILQSEVNLEVINELNKTKFEAPITASSVNDACETGESQKIIANSQEYFGEHVPLPFFHKSTLRKVGFVSLLLMCVNFVFYLGISELRLYKKDFLFYILAIPHLLAYSVIGWITSRFGRKFAIAIPLGVVILLDGLRLIIGFSGQTSFIIFFIKRIFTFICQSPSWTIVSEIVETEHRGKALTFAGVIALSVSSLSSPLYEFLQSEIYYVNIGFSILGIIILTLFVEESKGKILK